MNFITSPDADAGTPPVRLTPRNLTNYELPQVAADIRGYRVGHCIFVVIDTTDMQPVFVGTAVHLRRIARDILKALLSDRPGDKWIPLHERLGDAAKAGNAPIFKVIQHFKNKRACSEAIGQWLEKFRQEGHQILTDG